MLKILISLFFILTLKSSAQDGTIDLTFGNNGIGTLIPKAGFHIAFQKEGKIVGGGRIESYNVTDSVWRDSIATVRFTSEGILDSTFGKKGITKTAYQDKSWFPNDIAVQKDGKIVIGGIANDSIGTPCFGLLRFKKDGGIDSTFSGDGFAFIYFNSLGISDLGNAIIIQNDGKIVEVGRGQDDNHDDFLAIARVNENGQLDNTFGTGGKVLTNIGNARTANSVILQKDGKIVVGGVAPVGNSSAFVLIRFYSNGAPDNSFGKAGVVTTFFCGGVPYENNELTKIALYQDGKIVAAGNSNFIPDTFSTVAIARYTQCGDLDYTFGTGGMQRIRIPNFNGANTRSMVLQNDNKILISGQCANAGSAYYSDCFVLRCKPDGSVDSSFGVNGFIISHLDSLTVSPTEDMLIQNDEKIIVEGYNRYYNLFGLFRLNTSLDTTPIYKTSNSLWVFPNPLQSDEIVLEYTLSKDEEINIFLYDMQGRLVQLFVNDELRAEGRHEEIFCMNENLMSGIYFLIISNGKNSQGVKIVKE